MGHHYNHVNARFAVAILLCWFLVRLHLSKFIILKLLRFKKKIEAYNRLFGSQSTSLSQSARPSVSPQEVVRELMDPQRSLPFVIKAQLYLAAVAKRMTTTTVVLRGGDGGGWRRVMVGGG
ncbi:hypothetical protein HanIR_Chr01g0039501 [Helianthus annuus]|nr:hypothetical protein HanIR_Chr01g0039501 [Helianthus annuus]